MWAVELFDAVKDRSSEIGVIVVPQFNGVPETIHEGVVPGLADPDADREVVPGEEGNDLA